MAKEGLNIIQKVFGKPVFQFLATFSACLNLLNSGMHFGWTSPSLPKLLSNKSYIPLATNEASWIASAIMFGVVTGAILTAVLLDIIGRKGVILLASIPFFIAWILIAFAQSFTMLLIARIAAGIGDGLSFCSISIYVGEISEPKYRGRLGSGASAFWIFGMFLMNAVGTYTSIRTSALCSSVVSVLLLVTFSLMPESPYYLMMKNKPKEAAKNLRVLKGSKAVEFDLVRLTSSVQKQGSNKNKFLEIFSVKSNRKAFFVVTAYRVLQQCTGTTAIVFYAQILFVQTGDELTAAIGSVSFFAIFLIFNVVCFAIVDKTGRIPLLLTSVIGTGLTMLIASCYFYVHHKTDIDTSSLTLLPTITLLVYAAVYGIGLQPMAAILTGEMFATRIKPLAVCISHVFFAATIAIVLQSFIYLKENFGVEVPFLIYTIFCIVIVVFVITCVPETKNKTLEEIQDGLKAVPDV